MTRAKAGAIQEVGKLCAAGELDRAQLNRATDQDVIRHLIALPGIGPWTAEWFLINVLGRMSVVPAGDLGIRRSTGAWLLDGDLPSPAQVRQIYEPFGELRAYVAYYVLSAERARPQHSEDIATD
jgi:3-methyladenine DNA glycosylase/8-oxoguanine DNA glycosylase